VFPNFYHAFVVTIHAIDTLARLGEDELVDTVTANFTLETMGMVGIVASHNGFVENGETTYIAAVGAVGTYRGTIREEKEVCVGSNLIATFRAFETIYMKERLPTQNEITECRGVTKTHPKATTRPPCSFTADFLQPGQSLSSRGN